MASFFRRVAENWKLKTLALAMAALLWIIWSADAVRSNWIPVPLEVQLGDSRYRAVASTGGDIEVRFTGTGGDLLDVAVRRPPLRLTIDEVNDSTGEYLLEPRMVQIPAQLAVSALEVRPRAVTLDFVRVDSKVVRVRPRYVNALGADRMLIDSLIVEPAEVLISGPIAQVANITEVYTQSFDLASADSVMRRTVALDTTGISELQLGAQSVNVFARVDRVVERTIQNVRIDVAGGMSVTPTAASVRIRGPERIVGSITPGSFRLVVANSELPSDFPADGLSVPLRVEGLRADVDATIIPPRATLAALPVPTDNLQDSAADSASGGASDAAAEMRSGAVSPLEADSSEVTVDAGA